MLGATQILQDVWDAGARRAGAARVGRHVRAGGDAVPRRPGRASSRRASRRPPALRIFVVTGAAVPRALAEHATRSSTPRSAAPGARPSPASARSPRPATSPRSAGAPTGARSPGPGSASPTTDGTVLGAGEEGNFEVFSRCLFDGYLDRPDLTAAALTARRLVPVGRPRDDRQRRLPADHRPGQGRRQPRRREGAGRRGRAAAARHPAVEDVAIVAMPDPRLGERACAFVVARRDVPDLRGGAASSSTSTRSPASTGPSGSSRSRCCPATPAARSRSSCCASSPTGAEAVHPEGGRSDDPARRRLRHGVDEEAFVSLKDEIAAYVANEGEAWTRRDRGRARACRRSCATSCSDRGYLSARRAGRVRRPRHLLLALPGAARAVLHVARVAADDRARRQRRLALGRPVRDADEQRERFVLPAVTGDGDVAFTLTEPTAGTGADLRCSA